MEDLDVNALNSRFVRIGGETAVRQLTTLFYDGISLLPEAAQIRAMHLDFDKARAKLELFLIEWLGGVKAYSRKYGPPQLRMRHSRFSITKSDRDAWMTCMRRALEQVVTDASFREELESAFGHVADALVNVRWSPIHLTS